MKAILKTSLLLSMLVLFSTACKKKPAAEIYKKWDLTSATIQGVDQTTIDNMIADGYSFEFKKSGQYLHGTGAEKATGTFKISDDGKSITTTSAESTEVHNVTSLSETGLTLSNSTGSMTFQSK